MKHIKKYFSYVALIQALLALFGSLLFSDIFLWTPCVLCWYQRILMYPLPLILIVGILRKDKGLPYYILPLSILGMCVSLYHVFLQNGIITESLAPCQFGISCLTKYHVWFGFITIPLLSFVAFGIISLLTYLSLEKNKK